MCEIPNSEIPNIKVLHALELKYIYFSIVFLAISAMSASDKIVYCDECHTNPGKSIRFIDYPVCEPCSQLPRYNFITKSDAKEDYLVKDEDLNGLDAHQVSSRYGSRQFALLFNKLDIMHKSCERHSTTLEELSSVLESKKQDKYAKSLARKMKIQENRNMREALRREQMIDALRVVGLELRDDSKLCQLYIEGKTDNLSQIVRRMGEMRFLYEYCHMEECRDEAYKNMREERDLFGHCDTTVQDIAESIALAKYSRGQYPEVLPNTGALANRVFPWQ